jgi:hypothetical protein
MQCVSGIHMVSRSEVVMGRPSLIMSILAVASLAGGIPAIARAEGFLRLHGRSVDTRAGQRLNLVPRGLPAPDHVVRPSWQTIGSVTLPWHHIRLSVGYGPDGSLSLML